LKPPGPPTGRLQPQHLASLIARTEGIETTDIRLRNLPVHGLASLIARTEGIETKAY